MEEKKVNCEICGKEDLDWNMFDLETPNHIFEICIDCGSWEELEDLKKLIKEKKD